MALDAKKQDIEKLQEQEKALHTTFSSALGENNKFESFLTRVFKKKIRRAKKKAQTEEGSDEESEDEDSDEDLSSSDEEDSDVDDLDDSVCPPGCDQALFDQVNHSYRMIVLFNCKGEQPPLLQFPPVTKSWRVLVLYKYSPVSLTGQLLICLLESNDVRKMRE